MGDFAYLVSGVSFLTSPFSALFIDFSMSNFFTLPPAVFATVSVEVDGPVMTNMAKSNRSCKSIA